MSPFSRKKVYGFVDQRQAQADSKMSSEASSATSIRFVICLCMSCSPRELPPRGDPYLYLYREIPVFGQRVRLLKAGLFIYNLYHTAGQKGQAQGGGKKSLGRRARGRRKKRETGRGHYAKARPPRH